MIGALDLLYTTLLSDNESVEACKILRGNENLASKLWRSLPENERGHYIKKQLAI
jgi:hypothetical protein